MTTVKYWPMVRKLKNSLVLAGVICGAGFSASAQITGFYNLPIFAGDNLIANQFATGTSSPSTLDNVLTTGVPNGASFTEYDPNTHLALPPSVFTLATSTWSINYTFGPNGLGGDLNSPDAATVTLAGTVVNLDFGTGAYTYPAANYGPGLYLLALAAAVGPPTYGSFQQIVGRNPSPGDSVETLNGATQTYTTTTFNGVSWNNGTPDLAEGQAAFFSLSTPEPSTYALLILSAVGLLISRRFRSQNSRS